MSEIHIDSIWLEFESYATPLTDEEADNDFCNVAVTLSDASEYAFNVWTFKFLTTAVAECQTSGEHLAGLYLPPPDLFVRRLDRETIARALKDWLDEVGHFPAQLKV